MLIISFPHDKVILWSEKCPVYDTDDGVIEMETIVNLLRLYENHPEMFINLQRDKFGGAKSKPYKLPDGKYPFGNGKYWEVRDGKPLEPYDFDFDFLGEKDGRIVAIKNRKFRYIT